MSYVTLLHEKNPYFRKQFFDDTFFTLFVLVRASDKYYFSKYWGTDPWAVPQLKFWGNRPPIPPRSPPMMILEKLVIGHW